MSKEKKGNDNKGNRDDKNCK